MVAWESLARPAIFRIPAYVPGKPVEEVERELGLTNVLKLASNENPLGPSPRALSALAAQVTRISYYPDAGVTLLREALAARLALPPGQIIVGNGSDEIIRLAAEAFLGPDDEAVICEPTFGEYLYAVRLMGATPVLVRADSGQDLRAMLEAVTPRTRIVFFCNPNNPTGTIVGREEFAAFLRQLPPEVLVVYDAAYREYAADPGYPEGLDFVRQGASLLVLRTFSKIYGLAGLRIGYGVGPADLISLLYRVKEPFNVNLLAQTAALAALDDREHMAGSIAMNEEGRLQLYRGFSRLGLGWLPSQANFVLVDLRREARGIYEGLLRRGVIVRPASVFGLPQQIRVTVGTAAQNDRFLEALADVLGDLKWRKGDSAMIIIMGTEATPVQIEQVESRIRGWGFDIHLSRGVERTIIGAVGGCKDPAMAPMLEAMEGVERVVHILTPYKLAGREFSQGPTLVRVGPVTIGGPRVVIIAGPCAVENCEQIVGTARAVKAAGADMLRGGAYKPRSSPYSFQGLEEEGLKLLAQARAETGLPVVTEVLNPRDVDLVAEYADMLQIGARNMQNFILLREVGRAKRPVLLKRGLAATAEEWLMAAEYILSEGNYEVVLCERGIRTYETSTRNTLDISAIPTIKRQSHLPILADPSHGTGKRALVAPLARAALAAGADGVIVEVHPSPETALSDGQQSLTFDDFRQMMTGLRPVAAAVGREM